MNIIRRHKSTLIRFGLIIAFVVLILVTTSLTLKYGTITNAPTAAFSFLILVLFSAFFGDFVVAITTSLVATLCFNYFYLPPVGTFNIDAYSDWISLAAFLLTAVAISGLASSAAKNKTRVKETDKTLTQLTEFGEWLLSTSNNDLTLTKVAEEAMRIFSLEYCSLHVYSEGKWCNFTGTAASDISRQIESQLLLADHPTEMMEMADENALSVRYIQIKQNSTMLAMLAVKSMTLPTSAIGAMAHMIGIRLLEIMKEKQPLG